MSAAPHLLGMIVEGPGDARTVAGLSDRILSHEAPALAEDLESVRTFRGLDADKPFLMWREIDHEARPRRVPRWHGHFGGEPAIEDARTAFYALQYYVGQDPQPAAVLLVRDSDGKPDERRRGLEQARSERDWPFPVVIGVAHTMRECWVLAAFIPQNKEEEAALAALRKELGFNPTVCSGQLTASKETAKKSPKRVLSQLTGGDYNREAQCWTDASLEDLCGRGVDNGLAAFISEITERLVPVFTRR